MAAPRVASSLHVVLAHVVTCGAYAAAKVHEVDVRAAVAGSPLEIWAVPVMKAVPVWTLAFLVLGFDRTQPMLGAVAGGLLLSSCGDLFLELKPDDVGVPDDLLFIGGLVSFLLAHLLYVQAFRRGSSPTSTVPTAWLVVLGSYAAVLCVVLLPNIELPLRGPVIVYAVVLVGMAVTSIRQSQNALTGYRWRGPAGALVFVASDSVLAIDKFVFQEELPNAKLMVMSTYYTAQLFLALSAIVPLKTKAS